jgi:hypothetical protein
MRSDYNHLKDLSPIQAIYEDHEEYGAILYPDLRYWSVSVSKNLDVVIH